jgi:hypothetical protein
VSEDHRGGTACASITLALRRTAPDDYDVIQAGEIVGRIYRNDQVVGAGSGGLSATLDEAMAAFRAKWDAQG